MVKERLLKVSSESAGSGSSRRVEPAPHHVLSPQSLARLISNTLYSSSLMCAPVVVGLDRARPSSVEGEGAEARPYICCMDGLGAMTVTDKFAVSGTANNALYAICESYFQSGLEAGDLVNLTEKCIKLGLQRDVLSGCNVRIYLITSDGIFAKDVVTFDV